MPGWYFIVTLSAVGGQGKSFFSELVTLILRSLGCEVQVFSADVQQRLAAKLANGVTTIDTDLVEAASDDPLALLRAFSPCLMASIDRRRTAAASYWIRLQRGTSRS
jgi:hypothetical protein